MKKSQTQSEQVEVTEAQAELKPFFFSKEGETIMATSQQEAQEILAKRVAQAESAEQ